MVRLLLPIPVFVRHDWVLVRHQQLLTRKTSGSPIFKYRLMVESIHGCQCPVPMIHAVALQITVRAK